MVVCCSGEFVHKSCVFAELIMHEATHTHAYSTLYTRFCQQAPSPEEYHQETVRLVKRLHQWDVMRANKAPFSFGIEARVPFLDKEFLQLAMNINPREKMVRMTVHPVVDAPVNTAAMPNLISPDQHARAARLQAPTNGKVPPAQGV